MVKKCFRGIEIAQGFTPKKCLVQSATRMRDGSQFLAQVQGWVSISAIWYKDGSQFLPSGIKIGIDFQTPV